MATGVNTARQVISGQILSTHIVAHPYENLKHVLPIRDTEAVEKLRTHIIHYNLEYVLPFNYTEEVTQFRDSDTGRGFQANSYTRP